MVFNQRTPSDNTELLTQIFDRLDAAIWTWDVKSSQLIVSAGVESVFGCQREDFHRNPQLWQEGVFPEDRPLIQPFMDTVHSGNTAALEHRILRPTGEIRWVQCIATPVLDDDGQLTRINGVNHDITEQKVAQLELERQRSFTWDVLNSLDVAAWSFDWSNNRFRYISEAVSAVTGYPAHQFSDLESWRNIIHPADQYRFEEWMTRFKTGSAQDIELRIIDAGEKVRWVLVRYMALLNESGTIVGVDGLLVDITTRKRVEEAERDLAETEEKYRLIAENTKDLLAMIDVEGRFLYQSPSFEKVLGYDNRSFSVISNFEHIHPDDRNRALQAMSDAVENGESLQLRLRYLHADGHSIPIDLLGTTVKDLQGKVKSLVLVGRDMTEEARFEQKLVESEKRYRTSIELSPYPMLAHAEGKISFINTAGLRMLGASDSSELVDKSVYSLVHPNDLETSQQRVVNMSQVKYGDPLEYRLVRLDGKVIDVEVTGIYDDETESILLFFRDTTHQNIVEKALLESKERYRRMVEMSPLSIAMYQDIGLTYMNPAGLRLVGAERPEDYLGVDTLSFVHPDDVEFARKRIEQTRRDGYCPPAEYRLLALDGRVVDVSLSSLFDPVTGSVQLAFMDVTSRKQAESALRESEEINRRLVELSPEAIILHSDYQYILMNPAARALLGAPDDVRGLSILNQIEPECHDKARVRLKEVYEEGATSAFMEQRNVRFDGYVVDTEVISAHISFQGKNAGITLIRDITARKKAEELRKHAELTLIENQDRYYRLQTSLDRFSSDLFGVMKLQELERRLVKEVREVIKSAKVSVIEVDRKDRIMVKAGQYVPEHVPHNLYERNEKHPVSEIVDMPEGYLVKLGNIRGKIYLLCIGEKPPLLTLQPKRVWLETICRYVSVLYDNFRVIEDLTNELEQITSDQSAPSWLLRILFKVSEHERKRLSQDLHDAALQEQIIWYRKLDQLRTNPAFPESFREPLTQIMEGLLNVIYQIRITCNELRPPMLKQEGLVSSLETLFDFTQIRSNYAIRFDASEFDTLLSDDQVIGVYRIVQELLANATKHSHATSVNISLMSRSDFVELNYEDNGIGMDITNAGGTFKSMGVYGMKERVRSMGGLIELHSSPNQGLKVFIFLPVSADILNVTG